jgi:hypothetical protein
MDLEEAGLPRAVSRHLAHTLVRQLEHLMCFSPSDARTSQLTNTTSSSTPSSTGGGMGYGRQDSNGQGGKRKSLGSSQDDLDEGADDMSDRDGQGSLPYKRVKPSPRDVEENLRLSCPYRKRNPLRFNVREHHSCAMTYFPKFAELRFVPRTSVIFCMLKTT